MVTIIHKKKGVYKHFWYVQEGVDYMRKNRIKWHSVKIIKDHEDVIRGKFYSCITVIEIS